MNGWDSSILPQGISTSFCPSLDRVQHQDVIKLNDHGKRDGILADARQGPARPDRYPALGKHRNNEKYEKGHFFLAHFPRISPGYSTEMLSYVSLPEGTGKTKKKVFLSGWWLKKPSEINKSVWDDKVLN